MKGEEKKLGELKCSKYNCKYLNVIPVIHRGVFSFSSFILPKKYLMVDVGCVVTFTRVYRGY
uniref:Uncharacterized protein n=1 Tax=Rhizophora mucronata TaxID=61149 RepID=A0A2P2Q920_RHIMU